MLHLDMQPKPQEDTCARVWRSFSAWLSVLSHRSNCISLYSPSLFAQLCETTMVAWFFFFFFGCLDFCLLEPQFEKWLLLEI